ncbi:MAG: TCP-1/cpn60 chaperonin family protein [Thaumarchaeota archaeon]|jgi:thermosome|nr:TCP-1/cpn60 chaperonin family protein [Candidatus Terraquivivens yellowstonensis]MCL7398386.1 TCP-1/cpn60 chaperonin family protein [Candidatus Terraquivivens yellowstonensis]MCL7400245.1 TCP-1/cpn60 chaperonin family protein [Candidatus Terraquivivens yellowstonensis]
MSAAEVGVAQPVIILKEGTQRSRGRDAQSSNIMVAKIIAESMRTSLGPRGMDKMLVDSFGDVVITNDGATILKEMDVEHPVAKMLVEVAKAQDSEVGDGTTTAVVLAGELLAKAEELIEKEVHPTVIIDGYRKAAVKALEILDEISHPVSPNDRDMLIKVAKTSIASKLVSEEADYLSNLAVDAVLKIAEKVDGKWEVDLDNILLVKKSGQSLRDTKLIEGIVLDKEVVHPDMPKIVRNAKIAILDAPLEIEKTEFDAKLHIETPEQMKAFMKQEEDMLREMVNKIISVGANVVICQKGIDDLAQYFLAKAGILAVRRVKKSDMDKLAKATNGRVISRIDDLTPEDLGRAALVEERRVGEDKMVFIEGCENPKSITILIRGGTQRIVDEAERSLKDAINVVKDVIVEGKVVAGGGAPEIEVAMRLRDYANTLAGKEQLAVNKFAEALEIVPSQLAENAGMDPIETIVNLTSEHKKGNKWAGVDVFNAKIADMFKRDVIEPLLVKKQTIKSAVEAASMILKIDDIIAASRLEEKTPKTGKEEGKVGEGEGSFD